MVSSVCHSALSDLSPPSSVKIFPDRSQFFKEESVSLSCEVQKEPNLWKLMRRKTVGTNDTFSPGWGEHYTLDPIMLGDGGVYWCQSTSGKQSTAVNITVHGGSVIMQSPTLPVNGGHPVTLTCRYRENMNKDKSFSCLTDSFYKDGSLINNGTTGEMTIPVVNKSHEGLWKCSCGNHGDSPESWMTVTSKNTAVPPSSPSPTTLWSTSLSRLLCGLLVSSPYLMVTSVMLVKCSKRKRISQGAERETCEGREV
ncbi:hypothetical protein UPYG_G00246390 [Umbra pygmaea]|uniref:Immunoglobulin domain-containing protein n=1 Tax=Umbra pygmaea TaxID=75934 RepID=A0ABD0X6U7_UMBPY